MEKEDNNFDWLKKNTKIMLDQNIRPDVKDLLKKKGFINTCSVHDGLKGANDSKLLKILKNNKRILVTYDRKFGKQCKKYHNGMCILIEKPNFVKFYGSPRIYALTVEWMQTNFRRVYEYYNGGKE